MPLPLVAHVALICDRTRQRAKDEKEVVSELELVSAGFPALGSDKATDGDVPGLKMPEGTPPHRALSPAQGLRGAIPELSGAVASPPRWAQDCPEQA